MNKSVLISIRPRWIEKIARGEKTIEVRKTRPKLDPPFKCYIYCTHSTDHPCGYIGCYDHDWHTFGLISPLNIEAGKHFNIEVVSGKVVGEFTCDRIDLYSLHYCIGPGTVSSPRIEYMMVDPASFSPEVFAYTPMCLTSEEFAEYGGGKDLYGWHIADCKIYDETKELSEFDVSRAFQSWGYVYEDN